MPIKEIIMRLKSTVVKWIKEIFIFLILLFIFSTLMNLWRASNINHSSFNLSGKSIQNQKLKDIRETNKPTLVYFWGSWCPICSQEASVIQQISKYYPTITIAVKSGNVDDIKRYLKSKGVNYPVLNDKYGVFAREFNIEVYPTFLIYSPNGKLKFIETGYTTTLGLLARMKLSEF